MKYILVLFVSILLSESIVWATPAKRIANRQERRKDRRENRVERREDRQENRQDRREDRQQRIIKRLK